VGNKKFPKKEKFNANAHLLAPPSAEKVIKKSKLIKKGHNPHEITKEMVKKKL